MYETKRDFRESVLEWGKVACKLIFHGIGDILTLFSLEGGYKLLCYVFITIRVKLSSIGKVSGDGCC